LGEVRERLLPFLHLLLEIAILPANGVEIAGELLDCPALLLEVELAFLEFSTDPVVLFVELVEIVLLGIQLLLELSVLSPLIPNFVIEASDHGLPGEDLILKAAHVALQAKHLSAHTIELLIFAIQISLIVIQRVLKLADVLRFEVELLSKTVILILKLVYLPLKVENFVVGSFVVLFVIAAVLLCHCQRALEGEKL
jgi:hypothetical protein